MLEMKKKHLGRHKCLSMQLTFSSKSIFVDLNVLPFLSTLKLSTLISLPEFDRTRVKSQTMQSDKKFVHLLKHSHSVFS
jgi:hypothetical protein